MKPGMTVRPPASMTRAPGTLAGAPAATEAILPSRTMTWPRVDDAAGAVDDARIGDDEVLGGGRSGGDEQQCGERERSQHEGSFDDRR